MPSSLIVEISEVKEVNLHPNADRLEISLIKGWDVITQKGSVKPGDVVVFIPPDVIIPETLHTFLGITQYCASLPKSHEKYSTNAKRVKATRLRGVASYGTIIPLEKFKEYQEKHCKGECENFEIGENVAELLEIEKYEPIVKCQEGDATAEQTLFTRYTNIENWRNFPDLFEDGEEIAILEKINGQNNRVGCILKKDSDKIQEELETSDFDACISVCSGELVAGTHRVQRKPHNKQEQRSSAWLPFDLYPGLRYLVYFLYKSQESPGEKPVIIYGELYGMQDMKYGCVNGKYDYCAFDIKVGEQYLDFEDKKYLFEQYNIPMVPILYTGPYSKEVVEKHTSGPVVLVEDPLCKFKGREGCVITSIVEKETRLYGRKILKSVSPDYLDRRVK